MGGGLIITKRITRIFIILLFFQAFAVLSAQQIEQTDAERDNTFTNSRLPDEHDVYLDMTEETVQQEQRQTPSTTWLFVRMVLVLAVVIACIYAVLFFLKKGLNPAGDTDPYLRRTASLTLGQGKSVQVVTLGGEAYLLGVCDNSVTLLGKINDKDLVSAMNLNAEKTAALKVPRDFSSILAKFTGTKKEDSITDVTFSTENFLRSQRERLHSVRSDENVSDKEE